MPKHHLEKELQHLSGNPESFIRLLIKDKADREFSLHELTSGGPAHKQLYSNLLLQRMYALIKAVENHSGNKFATRKGTVLVAHKEDREVPVPLVLEEVSDAQKEAVEEVLSHAPAHEMIAFNSLLQGIEWCLSSLEKNSL
jgi:hypothetical protein